MGTMHLLAVRTVMAGLLVGTVLMQVVMVPLIGADIRDEWDGPGIAGSQLPLRGVAVLAIVAGAMVTSQVVLASVWRLVTMVRAGTVFSDRASRHVDRVVGAMSAAAALVVALGVVLAPGEAVPPGAVLMIGGLALAVAGAAMIVWVMRLLLAQAIARDAEAHALRSELDEVI